MTHLRFALDLASLFGIVDLSAYLSGSIYPDSRYVTGIQRNLTHGQTAPHDPFDQNLNDFMKGWATHLLYDERSSTKYKALSPWPDHPINGLGPEWIFITAEKIIEDLQSYDKQTITHETLQSITAPTPINQEDPALLAAYYTGIRTLYAKQPNLADYRQMSLKWKIDTNTINQLLSQTNQLMNNHELTEKISLIYRDIVNECHTNQPLTMAPNFS